MTMLMDGAALAEQIRRDPGCLAAFDPKSTLRGEHLLPEIRQQHPLAGEAVRKSMALARMMPATNAIIGSLMADSGEFAGLRQFGRSLVMAVRDMRRLSPLPLTKAAGWVTAAIDCHLDRLRDDVARADARLREISASIRSLDQGIDSAALLSTARQSPQVLAEHVPFEVDGRLLVDIIQANPTVLRYTDPKILRGDHIALRLLLKEGLDYPDDRHAMAVEDAARHAMLPAVDHLSENWADLAAAAGDRASSWGTEILDCRAILSEFDDAVAKGLAQRPRG